MEKQIGYNGWKNYETWRIMLEMFDGYEVQKEEFSDVFELADYLKDYVEEYIEQESSGLVMAGRTLLLPKLTLMKSLGGSMLSKN